MQLTSSGDGKLQAKGDGVDIRIPAMHKPHYAASSGKPLLLGIRPEDIYEAQNNPDWQPLDLTVVAVEKLGVETVVIGQIGNDKPLELNARVSRHFTAEVGQKVRLFIDTRPMHLLMPRPKR